MTLFETLFSTEATVGVIYFAFFIVYEQLRTEGQLIDTQERALLGLTLYYIPIALSFLAAGLFLENVRPGWVANPYSIGVAIGGVWLSLLFIVFQGRFVIRRLRKHAPPAKPP
jgi:tellurite resistance protein TehA-like permease